jgi:hypothetical protein
MAILTVTLGCNALFGSFNLGYRLNCVTWLLHVFWGEITEGRVLGFGEQFVVSELPWLTGGLGEHFLEVIFNQHT